MTATARVADLQPGDLTQHAGGSCDGPDGPPYTRCPDPYAPWRVEKTEEWHNGETVAVTWSHPPCGTVARPTPCSPDCAVEYFGSDL